MIRCCFYYDDDEDEEERRQTGGQSPPTSLLTFRNTQLKNTNDLITLKAACYFHGVGIFITQQAAGDAFIQKALNIKVDLLTLNELKAIISHYYYFFFQIFKREL